MLTNKSCEIEFLLSVSDGPVIAHFHWKLRITPHNYDSVHFFYSAQGEPQLQEFEALWTVMEVGSG